MGIDWNLAHPYLPNDRKAYPRAVFATLWTQGAEDADHAYATYRDRIRAGKVDHRALFDVLGGRPFRVPALEPTHQYRARWEVCDWTADKRGELARILAQLDGDGVRRLGAIVARKRSPLLSAVSYGFAKPDAALRQLVAAGCVSIESPPAGKGKDKSDRLIHYQGPTAGLVYWELQRRNWQCEMLVRYQYAYEATQSSLRQYRESGVVSHVEILGARECCPTCRRAYEKKISLKSDIEIPVPGCTAADGCICGVSPIVE